MKARENNTAMNKKNPPRRGEKFFFDLNVFDEEVEEEEIIEEELPPPAPVFSEQELETARREAFEQGRKEGLAESRAELERRIAGTLDRIASNMDDIFKAETAREKIYEMEAVHLALAVFGKLFPAFQQRGGLAELKNALTDIIRKQEGQSEILITVSPGDAEGVQAHVDALSSRPGSSGSIVVAADENIPEGGCRLAWKDGGAVRDPQAMAGQIRDVMEEALAARDANVHDGEEKKSEPAQADDKKRDGGP